MYLKPTSTHTVPVHSATDGWKSQKLVVDVHEFTVPNATRKEAYLFSHSNGFHKEAFHPLMKRFIDHLRSLTSYNQTDFTFVAWDARNHGDSARLNEGTFQDSYRWMDNAMDTLAVIDEMKLKEFDLFIGVGHSFGASSMILLEYFFPNTFDGLCVTEPVLAKVLLDAAIREHIPVLASRKRRDEWPSREECSKNLLKKPFFKLLHPEVLDNYVNYGTYETEKGTIRLKCTPEQEYHVFRYSLYDAFVARRSLTNITIPIHFIYALGSSFCSPGEAQSITKLNEAKVTLEFVEGTHMVPNETPEVIVPHIMKTIDRVKKETNSKNLKLRSML